MFASLSNSNERYKSQVPEMLFNVCSWIGKHINNYSKTNQTFTKIFYWVWNLDWLGLRVRENKPKRAPDWMHQTYFSHTHYAIPEAHWPLVACMQLEAYIQTYIHTYTP